MAEYERELANPSGHSGPPTEAAARLLTFAAGPRPREASCRHP
jgi:hypothetical protein